MSGKEEEEEEKEAQQSRRQQQQLGMRFPNVIFNLVENCEKFSSKNWYEIGSAAYSYLWKKK